MNGDTSRYACQLMLPGFGAAAQEKLQAGRVLIAGIGGLGCPAAQYLVSAGAGTIGLVDDDVVSIGNLHRQVLYGPGDAGRKKVEVARDKLMVQNPSVTIVVHDTRVNSSNVEALTAGYDIVLDCTDNFETRYLLNDACVLGGKPLVYGAIYQYEGQVAVWNLQQADGTRSPHYRDVFPDVEPAEIPNCATGGVMPTLAGIIGCMQANEAIKFLAGTGDVVSSQLMIMNVQTMQGRRIGLPASSGVPVKELPLSVPVSYITRKELARDASGYDLVDVRTTEEHAASNLGGRNVPLARLATLHPQIKPIVFYCSTGRRSEAAVRWMQRHYPSHPCFSLRV